MKTFFASLLGSLVGVGLLVVGLHFCPAVKKHVHHVVAKCCCVGCVCCEGCHDANGVCKCGDDCKCCHHCKGCHHKHHHHHKGCCKPPVMPPCPPDKVDGCNGPCCPKK